jgi:hypothetical protein
MRISLPPVVSQWTLIQDMVDDMEKDNPNINDLFEDTRGLFAGKSCPQISSSHSSDLAYDDFSDDPSLDESNRVSVLPDRQSTPGSLDDTVEFWSSMDTDLPMYHVSAMPKVEIYSYCFS